jgi:hypothetical protein
MSFALTDRSIDRSIHRDPAPRRVRQQARDAVAVMAFSAVTSVALATVLLLLANVPDIG